MAGADIVVVGAGLVGLQVALGLRRLLPQPSVVVLERGVLPTGASSRNAGFACFGSLTEILADITSMGEPAALALVEQRWRGIAMLRQLLGDEAIAYEGLGGHELLRASEAGALARLDEVNAALHSLAGAPVFRVDPRGPGASGFGKDVEAVVDNGLEGQLHPGLAMRALRQTAAAAGVEVLNGAHVLRLEQQGQGVDLLLAGGLRFHGRQVAVCSNALIPALLPDLDIVPGRGQVLLTAPVPGLRWQGSYHVDAGYYYFRNVGQRVLLGGGRNLDPAGEQTDALEVTPRIQQALETMLAQTILPGQAPRIEQRWAGTMGFTANKQPVVTRAGERVVAAFGCNGMGVALSPLVAAECVRLLADSW